MNSNFTQRASFKKVMDIMLSIEFFIAMAAVVSVLGFIFLAAV